MVFNGFSCTRSTKVPSKLSINMEFSFTTVSVSDEATMPTNVTMPRMPRTMLAKIIPSMLAKVNLKKSFMDVLKLNYSYKQQK